MTDPVARSVPLVIGVTGHRDLLPSEVPDLERAVELFLRGIRDRFPDLPLLIMTPLAEGADRLAARVARRLDIAIAVLLPMPRHIYQDDFDRESNTVFEEMLGYGEVIELPLLPDQPAADIARPGTARDAQYEYLGIYLAAHCHILLALWDGKPSRSPGGTAHVVQFHQENLVELVAGEQRRSPIDFSEDESDLVYHIVCSRGKTGAPAEGYTPAESFWLSRDDLRPRSKTLPPRYLTVFERQQEFNRDLTRLNDTRDSWPLTTDDAVHSALFALDDVHLLYKAADALAVRYQRTALRALRALFACAGFTGLSFIVYADFPGQDSVIVLYLAFLGMSIALYLLERRGGWYRKSVDYRGLAEGLRVQFYWALAGVRMENPARFSHDSFMKRQDLELGWIRNVMRFAGRRVDSQQAAATEHNLASVVDQWVGDHATGQTGYFRQRARDRGRRARLTNGISMVSFVVGTAIAVLLAVEQSHMSNLVVNTAIALMGGLTFLAAVRQSYANRVGERELIAQYEHYARIFSNAQRLLARSASPSQQRAILRALGEAALEENGLWLLRQRERPSSGGHIMHGG